MKFIGITGGVGAGKSQLLDFIGRHYKCKIYLADKVAFTVREPGTECYKKLVSLLGEKALHDNKLMAQMVFNDPDLLEKVNNIIHPAVKEYLLAELEAARLDGETEIFFVEAALLIEGGYKDLVDELWYVYASDEVRASRLIASRGYSREKALSIMSNQLSDEEFRKNCDFIIDNSFSLEASYDAIKEKLKEFTWLG